MVEIFDVSEVQFDRRFAKLAPKNGVRRDGRKVSFHARKLIDAVVADEVERETVKRPAPLPVSDETDPLLVSGDSQNLERYRLAKAIEVERKNDKEEGLLIPRPVIREALLPAAAAMRQAGERLAKLFGNDAHAIYAEAVQEYEAAIARLAGAA